MAIDVRKFINVNIGYSSRPTVISQRDTAVLVTSEGNSLTKPKTLVSSKLEWDTYADGKSFTATTRYVDMFFAHGGVNLLVIEGSTGDDILELDDKYIVVGVVNQSLSDIKTLAGKFDALEGVHRKLLVARLTYDDIYEENDNVYTFVDPLTSGYNSLAIKYSEEVGSEMAIAAYLTRINIYGSNTVHDYAFTVENVVADTSQPIDNHLFDTLSTLNFNFNIPIAGATRNIGGNLTSGRSVINEFMLIVLHQTVTDNLLVLLMSKIKGNQALSAIRGTITQELNRYVTNGYLDSNKIWSMEDWVVNHNSQNFTIIKKGTPLNLGYLIQVLPWSSLDSADKQLKKAPPIYIVLADSYGIRHIEVTGEVV